jgi:hypothetical protein
MVKVPISAEQRKKVFAAGTHCLVCYNTSCVKKRYCKDCKAHGRNFVYCGTDCQRFDWVMHHRAECMGWAIKAAGGDMELASAMVQTPPSPQT